MAEEDLPPSLRKRQDDLPPSMRSVAADELPPSMRGNVPQGTTTMDRVKGAIEAIPDPVRKVADIATRIPGMPGYNLRAGAELANTAVMQGVPAAGQVVEGIAKAGAAAIDAIPQPVKTVVEKQAASPFTPIGQATRAAKAGMKTYEVLSKPSRAVQDATEKFLNEQGVPSAWSTVGGFIAGAPLDPLTWVPMGKAGMATQGLTKPGIRAAEKAAAAMLERPGEALAAKVPGLVQEGNLKGLKVLLDSGKTNLALRPQDSVLLDKTIQKADQINQLWQTRQALRTGGADLVKVRNLNAKVQSLEDDLAAEIASPYGAKIDKLRARRDDLAMKTFNRGDENFKAIKDLNKQIEMETKKASTTRDARIGALRKKIDATTADMESVRKEYVKSATDKLQKNIAQLRGMKEDVAERLSVPVEKELLEGIVQFPDDGLIAKYARKPFQNLTFLTSKMDDLTNGGFSRYVFNPQIEAENTLDDMVSGYRNRLRVIQEKAGVVSPEDDKLFRMVREKKIPVPATKAKAFEEANAEYQKLMDEMLTQYNEAATKLGSKKLIVPKEDYVFHTRKQNALFDLTDGDVAELAKDADSAMYVKHNDPIFQSWKRRYDVIPENELAGAFEAADKYAGLVGRSVAYGPMVKKFRTLSRLALDSGKKNLSEQLGRIADNMTGDAAVKSGKGLEEATGGFADVKFQNAINRTASQFAQNAISSFSSGINQVAGVVNNAIYSGPLRSILAPIDGTASKIFERAAQSMIDPNYSLMAHKYSKVIKGHLADLPVRFGEKKANLLQRTTLEFFKYMNDAMNVGTFNQMYKAARVSGYSHEQAVKIADNILARSQAIYRDAFRPSLISKSSAIGRLVSPLSTYVFNTANALSQDAIFNGLSVAEKGKALARVMATGVLVNAGIYAASGKKPWSMSDAVPFLRMMEMGPGVFSVGSRSLQRARRGEYGMAVLEPAALLLPGGSRQLIQTAAGAKAIASGRVEGPIESTKALIFGPPYRKKE